MSPLYPSAVLFDLLTALLDSWTLWNEVAGSERQGRAWRAEYLRRTYACGDYQPYEQLVRESARTAGLDAAAPASLQARWLELRPWSGAQATLDALQGKTKLGVVTNCSVQLGQLAASRLNVTWDCVVTAEEAGAYKPDPRPYRLALAKLGVDASQAVFVAGSGYDLKGTSVVGLRTYWHNRIGLQRPDGAPLADAEERTLEPLLDWLTSVGSRR
ncbi:MAG: HAD-IA family hydrolase [Gemmatimonadaceae bacterium]